MKHGSHSQLTTAVPAQGSEDHLPAVSSADGNDGHPDSASALADLISRANAACERGDRAAASQCLAAARKHPLGCCEDALRLGYIALNLDESGVALQYFTIAACLAPHESLTHASRALALQLLDRSEEAGQAARRAIRLDSKDGVALKVLARISLNARRPSDARSCCLRILSQNADDRDAQRMLQECDAIRGSARTGPAGIPAPQPATLTPECALFGAPAASAPPKLPPVKTWEGLSDE